MSKSQVGVIEGSDKNIATYSFIEESITKHMERTVVGAPDISMPTSPQVTSVSYTSVYPYSEDTPASTTLSGNFSNFNASNSVDGNISTKGWDTNGDSVGTNLVISLTSSVDYTRVGLYINTANYDGKYDIKYSDDNSTWYTAYSNWAPTVSGWNYVAWNHVGKHQYWSIDLSTASSSVHGDFMELKFYKPDFISCTNLGTVIIKPLFSQSNTSANIRVVFYDSAKTIIGVSEEVSLYTTSMMENNKYIGSLVSVANSEVGATYINISVTSISNGTVDFVVSGG